MKEEHIKDSNKILYLMINVIKKMSKHCELIILFITAIGVLGSFIQKIFEYVRWLAETFIYGTTIELYRFDDVKFIGDIGFGIMLIILTVAMGICINNLALNHFNKEKFFKSKSKDKI